METSEVDISPEGLLAYLWPLRSNFVPYLQGEYFVFCPGLWGNIIYRFNHTNNRPALRGFLRQQFQLSQAMIDLHCPESTV